MIHTNQLQAGIYQRSHPDYTDQVETVEIWQKADDNTLGADVWVYDPPALAEPWYTKQSYLKLNDPDKSLRIRYWNCGENQNNTVPRRRTARRSFRDFTFDQEGRQAGRQAMIQSVRDIALLSVGARRRDGRARPGASFRRDVRREEDRSRSKASSRSFSTPTRIRGCWWT